MIGKIRSDGGEATLQDNFTWESENALLEITLNARFRPDHSPAHGDPGLALLNRAAEQLGGQVIAARVPRPTKPGRVY